MCVCVYVCTEIQINRFSPFENGPSYSYGAIYLSILNLPRSQRNLPSNILLIGKNVFFYRINIISVFMQPTHTQYIYLLHKYTKKNRNSPRAKRAEQPPNEQLHGTSGEGIGRAL